MIDNHNSIRKRKHNDDNDIIPRNERFDNRYNNNNNTSHKRSQRSYSGNHSSFDSYNSSESKDDNSNHYSGICGDIINHRCMYNSFII